jgi:hypothetical protein
MASSKYQDALKVLDEYWRRVVSDIADEILQNRPTFKSEYLGNAEDIVMRRSQLLSAIHRVRCDLDVFGRDRKSPKYRCRAFPCKAHEMEERLNAWLDENPECGLVTVVPTFGEGESGTDRYQGFVVVYVKAAADE